MNFEHLVEVNDFDNFAALLITRAQLWQGLRLRAESPKLFVPYLDACDLREVSENGLRRVLRYGQLQVEDQVHFEPMQAVHYAVPAQGEIPASSLCMRIEEPNSGALFVRFSYADGIAVEPGSEAEMLNEYRRSAYLEADIDTMRLIREFAETGRLDAQ